MALDHLDSAVTSAGMAGRVEKGSLQVGLFSSLASGFLPELLRCYSAKHPEIDVSIVEGPPSENPAQPGIKPGAPERPIRRGGSDATSA